jgi:hypothetical protein
VFDQRTTKASIVVSSLLVFSFFLIGATGGDGTIRRLELPRPQLSSDQSTFLQVGEELEYAVSYSFFSIGTISFKILEKGTRNGRTIFKAKAIIESNPSLSWLKEVHIRFYGEIDDSIFSQYWMSKDSSSSGIDYHSLTFDYDDSKLVYEKGNIFPSGERKILKRDSIRIDGPGQDGLSLFFYAREHARQKMEVTVPTYIENKEANAHINFQDRIEDVEIDAVRYPVETVFLDGRADFVGVVGMTGGFRGWFSNDRARIPIVARLNVWIGSIKVELKSWKRSGWQPPQFVEPN